MATTHKRVGVEEGLKPGLRNRWYVVGESAKLGDKPMPIKALGENLVLWRDDKGKAHCMTDLCPHRGAKMSLGEVVRGELTCWYHGASFNGEGTCTGYPPEGTDSKLPKRMKIKSYPVQERVGLIWAYIGEVELFPPMPLELPEELESPDWSGFICHAHWKTNWLLAYDNLADPMHGPYLHGRSYTLRFGAKEDRMVIVDLPHGFRAEREKQKGVNFDWSELGDTGTLFCRLDIPYPPSAGPGGPLRIVGFVTPNDENEMEAYFLRYRELTGWKRNLWRFLYKNRLEKRHWKVLEQDRVMLENMNLACRLGEHIAQTDIGVIRLRKLINMEFYRQQAIYAEHAAKPKSQPVDQSIEQPIADEVEQSEVAPSAPELTPTGVN